MSEELFEGEAVAERQEAQLPAVVQSTEDRLLEKVMDSGNIEVLERYIALRKSEAERQAKLDFDEHFAAMQKDYVPVYKDREVLDISGKHMYNFCALENIVDVYGPILSNHGFSYFWDEEAIDDKNKRIWCHICGYGHERKGYVDVAIQEANKYGNAIQQRGVSSSYGQRYSLKNALGIVERNSDTDGNLGAIEKEAEPFIEQIMKCKTREDVGKAYLNALAMTSKNKAVQGLIALAKDTKLRELKNVAA